MRWPKSSLLFLVLVLSLPVQVSAQDKLALGQTYTDAIRLSFPSLGKTQIPLPPGKWEVVGYEEYRTSTSNLAVSRAYLVKIEGGVFKGRISLRYNHEPPDNGWGASSFCSRTNIHHIEVKSNWSSDVDCWGVNHAVHVAGKTAAGKQWRRQLQQKNVAIPTNTLQVQFDRRSAHKYLKIRYYFNPEAEGFSPPQRTSWKYSDWHPANVQSDPKKVAYIERLKAWGKSWKPKIDLGFEGKLQTLVRAAPKAPHKKALKQIAPSVKGDELTQRLRRLKGLYDKGLITKTDYADKRKALLKGL